MIKWLLRLINRAQEDLAEDLHTQAEELLKEQRAGDLHASIDPDRLQDHLPISPYTGLPYDPDLIPRHRPPKHPYLLREPNPRLDVTIHKSGKRPR